MKSIDNTIKQRKTQKILANEAWAPDMTSEEIQTLVSELLDLASHAPYHYRAHESYMEQKELNSCLPFRIYALEASKCRELVDFMDKNELKAGKIKNLMLSANAVLIVTWLPEPHEENTDGVRHISYEGNLKNMEHIAAASTAVQNMLLGATERNIPSYWSTGGKLRDGALRDYLEIPADEIMIGSIFLFPRDYEKHNPLIVPGALRNEGKEVNSWSKWIQ